MKGRMPILPEACKKATTCKIEFIGTQLLQFDQSSDVQRWCSLSLGLYWFPGGFLARFLYFFVSSPLWTDIGLCKGPCSLWPLASRYEKLISRRVRMFQFKSGLQSKILGFYFPNCEKQAVQGWKTCGVR